MHVFVGLSSWKAAPSLCSRYDLFLSCFSPALSYTYL